jgi:WD40 repeat protein
MKSKNQNLSRLSQNQQLLFVSNDEFGRVNNMENTTRSNHCGIEWRNRCVDHRPVPSTDAILVHIDAQGLAPPLPDAHSVNFPVLAFPSSTADSSPIRQNPDAISSPNQLSVIETFIHRLLGFTSVPVDLLIPPYSTPSPPSPTPQQPPRIGKIALHPDLPVLAIAQAHPGGFVFLFDLRTNAYLKYKLAFDDSHRLNALAFSKYNLLAAGTSSGQILLFELNLSVTASNSNKPLRLSAIPSFAPLIPPQFPSFALLGEIKDLDFDYTSARYLAVATTRSGTWIFDTVYSSSLRLSKCFSSSVAFSPTENILAVARERSGEIELYTMIRAGTLTFSRPTVAKSGFKSAVTHMQWTFDGKSLLYCNEGQEGIRILHIRCQSTSPPGTRYNSASADNFRSAVCWKHSHPIASDFR